MSSSSPLLARLAGDLVRAGDLYYQRGRLAQAARMYDRAGSWEQAARVFLELGDRAGAVGSLVKAGNHLRAGELLAEAGDHKEAIGHFERARAFERAAVSSLALQQPQRAAQLYERAGRLSQAASCYEKSGELDEALRVLERESRALEQRFRTSADEALRRQRRQVDLHQAGLLARVGRLEEAAGIFGRWEMQARAAELFERAGLFDRAARSFLEADLPQRALEMLDSTQALSPLERGRIYRLCQRWELAASAFEKAGQITEAADCLESAADWGGAAELWERAGESERAGDLYFRVERWPEAARCFVAVGRPDLAAQAYRKIPDHAATAACLAEVGQHLEAARHYLLAGDRAGASQALQEVPPESPDFSRATLLLAPLLVEDGYSEGALHRLTLLPEDPSGTGSLMPERFYWEGRALEALGRVEEALGAYQRAVGLRRDHRDAAARIEALRNAARREDTQAVSVSRTPTGWSVAEVERGPGGGNGELRTGDLLAGRYLLVAELGRGGMGRVYKAEDRELGELVALKTLLSRGGSDSSEHERLLREVQICRRITHPNVVRVHDVGRFDGGIFVTMEYLEGQTLDRTLRGQAPMPLARVRSILAQLLAGLREAHRLKVVHRDLKPSNILLSGDQVKILDFGIARMEGRDVDLTIPGEVLGSPKYMSPEQIQGEELDGRSDLYSLGVLLYALLTGREPFTGKTPSAIAIKQLRDPPPEITDLRPDLPPSWRGFLDRLLAKERKERWASAEEVLGELERLPVDA